MTKIFAISSNVKEGDEKPKEVEGIKVSSATPQATLYPVTLPISSVVARKRCGTSHLVIILLSLMTISVLFYMIPDLFYRRVHHLVSSKVTVSGSTSPWGQRSGRFDVAEEDARALPKLDSFLVPEKMNRVHRNGHVMVSGGDGRFGLNEDEGNAGNTGGEVKQPDSVPNRFETMKAIATLLKIPGVQQVAVVQNNGRISDNVMTKPEIIPDVQLPSMEAREWELMNYRRVIREWLLRREMLRRRILAELERERQEAAERKMSQFMMELQLKEQQEPPQLEQVQSVQPVFAFARMQIEPSQPVMWMNNAQPPMGPNQRNMPTFPVMPPPMTEPRISPIQPYMMPKQEQEQQQPAVMPVKLMQPQMLDRELPVFLPPFGSNPEKPNALPLQIRDDTINRLDMEQKIPVPVVNQPVPLTVDGTPDRDTIFKELRSRAQMQQQMSQTILPAAMVPPLVPKVAQPPQINSDEIFRELQHRALRMQIEQDRMEAKQRAEKEKSADAEVPVAMIADAFPRQPHTVETVPEQTSEELAGASNAINDETTMKASNPGDSLESVQTPLNVFEKGFPGNGIINSLDKEQQIVVRDDNVNPQLEHSNQENTINDMPASGNDEVGLVVKPDEFAPQINFVQEPAITEAPASMDISGEAYPKLFKLAASSNEPDDTNGSDILDIPVKLLTPQIQ